MFKRSLATKLAQGVRTFSTTRTAFGGLRAGVLLQRDPIVLQQTKGFEAASDEYFQWLEYLSAEAFPRDFYLKKGSSAEAKWVEIEDERAAKWYFDPESRPKTKSLKKAPVSEEDSTGEGSKRIEVQPRETEADKAGDVKSLERKLDRTLYLLVKDKSGSWVLPQGEIEGDELLHEAARRNLKAICGGKMSTWFVGRGPVGHHKAEDHTSFYIKAHILAGQASPQKSLASDFKWATREEVESSVSAEYWQSVKDMLTSI
ncbi:hypothetical protein GQ54DRAFT_297532 [Martensiomyces pterosporus]|nr:hypothetical protein GQ54DRAFT_297532 [Martensiomyces pterosporus]